MTASNKIRLVAAVVLLLLLAGCNSSTPPKAVEASASEPEVQVPAGSLLLKGAGATFPSLLYKRWFTVYHDNHPDTYIKYALTSLPEVPQALLTNARARAVLLYEQVNLTAAREFQRRRDSGAYAVSELGIECGSSDPSSEG